MEEGYENPADAAALLPSMLIGVPAIDEQHRSLISDLNRLLSAPHAQPSSELFGDVLSRLGVELSSHFEFEERYLSSLGLPAKTVQGHMAAHAEILRQYTELNLDLMRRHSVSRLDALRQVREWVVGHILTHDLRMRASASAEPQSA